jgi:hypothetical protein
VNISDQAESEDYVERQRRDGDARCGTTAGATRHSKNGDPPCDACRAAKAEYDRRWRSAPEAARRNRLHAKAQARAMQTLRLAHPDEYRAAYLIAKAEVFTEAGLRMHSPHAEAGS